MTCFTFTKAPLVLLFILPFALSLTITVPNRSKFCFYEDVTVANKHLAAAEHAKLSFAVLRGGKYKDIVAVVVSNHAEGTTTTHVRGRKVTRGQHQIPLITGNYSICFDNTFSVVTNKVVEVNWEMPKKRAGVPSVKTAVEYSAQELKMKIVDMTKALRQLRHRTISSSDYAESLNYEVNFYSVLTSIVIMITAATETYALRSMFETKPGTKC